MIHIKLILLILFCLFMPTFIYFYILKTEKIKRFIGMIFIIIIWALLFEPFFSKIMILELDIFETLGWTLMILSFTLNFIILGFIKIED